MSISQSVSQILSQHVVLEMEGIDRMYLNVYVPQLQCEPGVVGFFRHHRGSPFVSSALMAPMSQSFLAGIDQYVKRHRLPVVSFRKGERKDDVAHKHLSKFKKEEGVVFVGKAQEKAWVFRTEKRHNPQTGRPYPWIVHSTAMVNQFYFYVLDKDFGPIFLKFCSYFPYNAKLYLNGHEYVKRQLTREGIAFQALDNVILP